jgi:hypothetical protein
VRIKTLPDVSKENCFRLQVFRTQRRWKKLILVLFRILHHCQRVTWCRILREVCTYLLESNHLINLPKVQPCTNFLLNRRYLPVIQLFKNSSKLSAPYILSSYLISGIMQYSNCVIYEGVVNNSFTDTLLTV